MRVRRDVGGSACSKAMSRSMREAQNAPACSMPVGFVPPRGRLHFLCADKDVLNGRQWKHAVPWRRVSCAPRVERVGIMGRDLSSPERDAQQERNVINWSRTKSVSVSPCRGAPLTKFQQCHR